MPSAALTQDKKAVANDLSKGIIGAAIEVHRILRPGLLESEYEECIYHELSLQGTALECQVPLPEPRLWLETGPCGWTTCNH
jgi:hypothetical protein